MKLIAIVVYELQCGSGNADLHTYTLNTINTKWISKRMISARHETIISIFLCMNWPRFHLKNCHFLIEQVAY